MIEYIKGELTELTPSTGETWVCNPRIDICNGSQPSIESLLHGNTHVMQWYSGTGITGTSTSNTQFPNSGIDYAVIGDKYINTDTNNVYRCTYNGTASIAMWVYETNIKGATGATGATGTRGSLEFSGTEIFSFYPSTEAAYTITTAYFLVSVVE